MKISLGSCDIGSCRIGFLSRTLHRRIKKAPGCLEHSSNGVGPRDKQTEKSRVVSGDNSVVSEELRELRKERGEREGRGRRGGEGD